MNQSRGVDYDKQEELGGSEYENRIVSKEKKKKKLIWLLDRFGIASAEVFVVRDGLKIHCFSHSHLST